MAACCIKAKARLCGQFGSKSGHGHCQVHGVWVVLFARSCSMCHWPEKGARHLRRRYQTKWARYEIRSRSQMQAAAVYQHSQSAIHKLACEACQKPKLPLTELLQATHEDDLLLKGSVPQPADWLSAWRAVRSPISFSKAEAHSQTAFYAAGASERGIGRRCPTSNSGRANHEAKPFFYTFLSQPIR